MQIRRVFSLGALVLLVQLGGGSAGADEDAGLHNQIILRGGYAHLTDARDREVFTDTLGTVGLNDDDDGFSVAAAVDLSALRTEDLGGLNLMGEIFLEYSEYSDHEVLQTTSALLGGNEISEVSVSSLNVTVAPKARFDGLGNGRVRPFVIPVGLSFLVNSPPSNDTTYLDVGLHFGGGLDVVVIDRVSVGVDFRYTHAFEQSDTNTRYWSTGGYIALNF